MKRLFVCFLLLNCYFCLTANPMDFMLVSEYWFNADNEMLVELCPSFQSDLSDIPLNNIQFTYNGQTAVIPNNTDSLSHYSPVVINMSELYPPLNPTHTNTPIYVSLINDNITYYEGESFGWYCDILPDSMSMVHWYNFADTGSWNWVLEIPPTPGSYPYHPQTRAGVRIYCHDQFDNPLPNVQLYIRGSNWPFVLTGVDGVYQDSINACNCHIYTSYNGIWTDQVFSSNIWLQPNQLTEIDIPISVVANDDPTVPSVVHTGMKIYPVPFNQKLRNGLCFQLPDNLKKFRSVKLKIYNAKGQFVTELTFAKSGLLRWQPEKNTPAGIYAARLICDNRIIETARFSILK